MYMPVTNSPASAPAGTAGMGYFRRMNAALQESEFYPPPYNTDAPLDLSSVYGSGKNGMGLFDSADWTTWGYPEWGMIAAGLYFGMSLLGDLGRGAKQVRKTIRRRRRPVEA